MAATLTDRDRDRLRKLQDRWLVRCGPSWTYLGEDQRIIPGGPTWRQVRETLLPDWEHWFRDDLSADD